MGLKEKEKIKMDFKQKYEELIKEELEKNGFSNQEIKEAIDKYFNSPINIENICKLMEEIIKCSNQMDIESRNIIILCLDQINYKLMEINISQKRMESFLKQLSNKFLVPNIYEQYCKEWNDLNHSYIEQLLDKKYYTNIFTESDNQLNKNGDD